MFSQGLFAILSTSSAIQSVVGNSGQRTDGTTGIFHMLAVKQASMPHVVFFQVGDTPIYTLQGQVRLQAVRYRFSCYDVTMKGAKQLARQVMRTLNSQPIGPMPGQSSAELHGQFKLVEIDNVESEGHMTIFSCHIDFEFWFIDTDQTV